MLGVEYELALGMDRRIATAFRDFNNGKRGAKCFKNSPQKRKA